MHTERGTETFQSCLFQMKKKVISLRLASTSYSMDASLLLSIHKRSTQTKNRLLETFLLFSQHAYAHRHSYKNIYKKNITQLSCTLNCRCVWVNNRDSESISIIQMFICKAKDSVNSDFCSTRIHSIILAEASTPCASLLL